MRATDLSLALLLALAHLAAAAPGIFPKPRQIALGSGAMRLDSSVFLALPLQPSAEDTQLARLLTAELVDRYGYALPQKRVAALPLNGRYLLIGSIRNPLVAAYAAKHGQPPAQAEGYSLEAAADHVAVAGRDREGAFYGLQSLRQLISHSAGGPRIANVTVRDWPLKPFRGVKLYLPDHENIPYLKRLIRDVLALSKYNKLILEVGGAMRLDRHPEVNAGWLEFARNMLFTRRERAPGPGGQFQDSANSDTAGGQVLEKEEVADLVEYARRYHMEVIPEIPSLTHSYYLLARHRELAEIADAEWPDTYCPSETRVYDLLFHVLDEYIEVMHPAMVHIGHDEWRIPVGVCRRCRGKDPTALFAADVNRIHAHLRAKGVRVAMYGDHLMEPLRGKKVRPGKEYEMPGALSPAQVRSLIPKDILIFNWFWDGRSNEDLANGLGRANEQALSKWGFQQIFANFEPYIDAYDLRAADRSIIGGAPSSWAATTELNIGKDLLFSFLGCANLLWGTERPGLDELALGVQQRLPWIRDRLSAGPLPSNFDAVKPVAIAKGMTGPVAIGEDVSSIIFVHNCRERGQAAAAYTKTWNFADTAELVGWYEVLYADGYTQSVPVRYGVNILEANWLHAGHPRAFAYQARLTGEAFAYEWINPRFGVPVRSITVHSSDANPLNLAALEIVPKRQAPAPLPLRRLQ